MRDGGVGEQPLHVGLGDRDHRADDHGEDRHHPQGRPPVPGQRAERHVEDPQQGAEGGDHGAGRHQRGDRGRRALVDVRLPGLEGHRADLEQQPDAESARSRRTAACRCRCRTRRTRRWSPARPTRRTRTASRRRTGRTPRRTSRAGSTSWPLRATAGGGGGPGRTAGTAGTTGPRARRTSSAGRSRPGRAACRRPRTGSAGRSRCAPGRPAGPRAPRTSPGSPRPARRTRTRRATRRRSAARDTAARTRIVPWMNSVGRSTATAPSAATCPALPLAKIVEEAAITQVQTNAATSAPKVSSRWIGAAQLARREGLDEHADDGRAEDDQHRRELAVLDARGLDRAGNGSSDSGGGEAHGWFPFWATAGWAGTGSVAAHLGHRGIDGRVDHVKHRLGVDAHRDDQRDERHHREQLARPAGRAWPTPTRRPARSSCAGTSTGCRSRPG